MPLKKTLLAYLLAYTVLASLIYAVLLPISNRAVDVARERVVEEKQKQIELGLESLDNQIMKYMQTASALTVNRDLFALAASKETVRNTVNMLRIQKQIRYYVGMLDYVEDCMVIFPEIGTVISSKFISPSFQQSYDVMFSIDNLDEQEAYDLITTNSQTLLCVPVSGYSVEASKINEPYLLFLSCGSIDAKISDVCSFMFVIRASKFMKNVLDLMTGDCLVFLTDHEGTLLYSNSPSGAEAVTAAQNGETISIDEKNMCFFSGKSNNAGLRLVFACPESFVYKSTLELADFFPYYIVLSMVSIALLCVCYALWHYRRVSQLVNLGESISDLPYGKIGAFRYVKDVMNHVSAQNKDYFFRYTQTDHAYLNSMLMNACMHGVYSSEEIEALKMYVGELREFCLIQIRYPEAMKTDEILQKDAQIHRMYSEDGVFFVIHPKPFNTIIILEAPHGIAKVREKLINPFINSFDEANPIKIGMSDVFSGVDMIQTAYQQANFALSSLEAQNNAQMLSVYIPTEQTGNTVTVSMLQKLNDLILYGKEKEVEMFFEEIQQLFAVSSNNQERLPNLYYSLQMVLENLASELQITFPRDEAYPQLSLTRLRKKAKILLDCIRNRHQHCNAELSFRIMDAMKDMMSDPALNAATIAEKFGISEKYVYRVIKEESGKSPGVYLEELRIRKAEDLLLSSKYNNEQIADEVGFASLTTFYRSFRKIHGVSPAAWRDSVKTLENDMEEAKGIV